jgi:hypothetical protein
MIEENLQKIETELLKKKAFKSSEAKIKRVLSDSYDDKVINEYLDYRYRIKNTHSFEKKNVSKKRKILIWYLIGFLCLGVYYFFSHLVGFEMFINQAENFDESTGLFLVAFRGILVFIPLICGASIIIMLSLGLLITEFKKKK